MTKEEKRLDRLNELLFALPVDNMPMTLSELDGYLTGVLACPEIIPPSEWLPEVWGETGEAHFADPKAAEETIGAVMMHYNSMAETITRSRGIEPIYEVDPNSDETLWEPWVDGFTHAMRLRPDAWENLLERADEETQATMIFMMALQDIYTGKSKFTDEEIDEIDREAPDLIPNCVTTILRQSRPELAGTAAANFPGMPHKAEPRPGRNDPCSCGSGRKYKQCCSRN
ncbi:UPF0149 family protein [Seohaeicola saemankumensis]|uniref:UPF0149 family protein n=1 Tax=Seohaeicola TaxID=481178 RepID=UPI0035CEB494